jgi:hypothetical protein
LWEGKIKLLKKPQPWLALAASILVFSPVIIWNFQHEFASFAFQAKHGLAGSSFKWSWPLEYLSGQAGLLNPVVTIMGLVALRAQTRPPKLIIVFGLAPLLFFLMTSFRARVEANWPICAYPAFTALAIYLLEREWQRRRWERVFKGGLVVSSVFVIAAVSHTIKPWLPIPKGKDHTEITRAWNADVSETQDLHPLFARSYQMASFHSYFRPADREVFKLAGLDRKDLYDFLPQARPQGDFYLIVRPDDLLPEGLRAHYGATPVRNLASGMVVYHLRAAQ